MRFSALLWTAGCSVFLTVPEPADVGFPGRADSGLLDAGLRDVRPDAAPMDWGMPADAGGSDVDVADAGVSDTAVIDDAGAGADVLVVADGGERHDAARGDAGVIEDASAHRTTTYY